MTDTKTQAPSVTVVGCGLAGLSAARVLAQAGIHCNLVSPQPSERAQSVMAEGGINAALNIMGEDDSPEQHYEDTLKGGVWLADPNAVWNLTQGAPDVVRDLIAIGVPFQVEKGTMIQRNFGGQKKKRTAYAKSSTGKILVTALIDAVRQFEVQGLVTRLPRHEFLELAVEQGVCQGMWVRNVYTEEVTYLPGRVILCSGGIGGMLGAYNTGTTQNTGDVTARVFAQGVTLGNLEFLQYHPTTVPITGKRMLISEAARGEGGRVMALRNGQPWYFMEEKYPPPQLGNLMPRDVVSREEFAVIHDPECTGQVWLDMRELPDNTWKNRLSDLREECIHYLAIDPAKELLPVEPGIHYSMGGILVDTQHRTNMPALYAAGECACQYHGANRLGGNSLLGAVFGGRVAAATVVEDLKADAAGAGATGVEPTQPTVAVGSTAVLQQENKAEQAIQAILAESMGIIRTADGLQEGLQKLEGISTQGTTPRLAARKVLAQAMVQSALARCESRGAHQRSDFPQTSDEFKCTTVATYANGEVAISFNPLPELNAEAAQLLEAQGGR